LGITSGVSDFGESGCRVLLTGVSASSSFWRLSSNSAHSSSTWPLGIVMQSARWCILQEGPGALMDRSWKGGRPGIVAVVCERPCPVTELYLRERLTRIHRNFMNRRHGPEFRDTDLSPPCEGMFLDAYPQSTAIGNLFRLLAILTHGMGKGLLRVERLRGRSSKLLFGEELVLPLRLVHPPAERLL
jgi:hypothetical protein